MDERYEFDTLTMPEGHARFYPMMMADGNGVLIVAYDENYLDIKGECDVNLKDCQEIVMGIRAENPETARVWAAAFEELARIMDISRSEHPSLRKDGESYVDNDSVCTGSMDADRPGDCLRDCDVYGGAENTSAE